ncbi:MAG TPA: OmpA family protein [Steroidobacteraceae bacterium]|nr:OmpA family protein [Steroidobacteraceae bacterium]
MKRNRLGTLPGIAITAHLALVGACAVQPPVKPAPLTPAAVATTAHGAVTPAEARREKMKALVIAGVAPLEAPGVPAYLDALDARLRPTIAGNTAELVRVDDELVVVLPARALFAPDAAELTPAGEKFLAGLAGELHGEKALLVEAACHTDRLGNPQDNEAFSRRRAELVLATLTTHGLDAGRIIAVGSGDHFPIADNATADGRRQNRRVELSLIPITR